jgi:hypothetical protein
MSYRYNTIDIIVGVGMCAIIFGAALLFVAADGTFQPALTNSTALGPSPNVLAGTAALQSALGQAIVEKTLLQRRTDRLTVQAISEWNQAMRAHHSLQSVPGGPLGMVIQRAQTMPAEHAARVQAVMGRTIVNFTRRGIHSGALSADQYLSDYNTRMIGLVETMGQRLDRDFESAWQPMLGRWVVEASRDFYHRERALQEQLGLASVRLVQAQTALEEQWALNQYQLASLVAAAERSGGLAEPVARLGGVDMSTEAASMASTGFATWPDIPIAFLIVAVFCLSAIFFGGLVFSARLRELRIVDEMKRDAARWVYRMAA